MSITSRRSVLKGVPALLLASRVKAEASGRYLIAPPRMTRNSAPGGVVRMPSGPQLFVDDYLALSCEGLARTTHHPRRLPQPVITSGAFGVWQPFISVVRDRELGMFRAWYNAWAEGGRAEKLNHLAYAESKDGIEWNIPRLSVIGSSNLLMPIPNGYGVSVIDEGPCFADGARRFKLAWWGRKNPKSDVDSGMFVAFSEDGLIWKPFEKNPVLPNYPEESDPRFTQAAGDVIDVFWNPITARYAAFVKTPAVPEDGYLQAPKSSKNIRRLVSYTTSTDFVHWSIPARAIVPAHDEGLLEFYAAGATAARSGLLIGFPRMLHDELSANPDGPPEGIGYSTLVTSRDGETWERHADTFLNRNLDPGAWDHAMSWIGCQLPVGDEIYLYYGGYKQGHKINKYAERQIGLARLQRDRFVSRDAVGSEPGVLLTPLLDASVAALTVNASATRGEIRVQLRDHSRRVIPGFGFADCAPVSGDGLTQPVRWPSQKAGPGGPVHIEFHVRDARLFGFELEKEKK